MIFQLTGDPQEAKRQLAISLTLKNKRKGYFSSLVQFSTQVLALGQLQGPTQNPSAANLAWVQPKLAASPLAPSITWGRFKNNNKKNTAGSNLMGQTRLCPSSACRAQLFLA